MIEKSVNWLLTLLALALGVVTFWFQFFSEPKQTAVITINLGYTPFQHGEPGYVSADVTVANTGDVPIYFQMDRDISVRAPDDDVDYFRSFDTIDQATSWMSTMRR